MAEFGSAVITDAGAALLAQVMAGSKKLEFTALTVGDGTYTAEEKTQTALQAMTAMKNQRLSFPFNSVAPYSNTTVKLKAVVSNVTVTSGFYINEVGIWAKDASDALADPILYSIVVANTPDYLPAYNGSTPSTIEQDWYTTLSNNASSTIVVDDSAYTLLSDFEEFKDDTIKWEFEYAYSLCTKTTVIGVNASGNREITETDEANSITAVTTFVDTSATVKTITTVITPANDDYYYTKTTTITTTSSGKTISESFTKTAQE